MEIFTSLPIIIPSQEDRENLPNLIETWMRQNLSNEHLYNGVFDALASAVYTVEGSIQCSVPLNSTVTVEDICCSDMGDC